METALLYYQDVYLRECSAKILKITMDKQGPWLLPDQTIFYPGGGGQPADSGSIDGKAVESIRKEDKQIWHLVPGFQGKAGNTVKMQIDWPRRFYMMQQHSGQHLISNVAMDYKFNTVSVHFGEEHTLIEFDTEQAETQVLAELEEKANTLIRDHLPLHIHWADRETAKKFPLRRPAGDWELLRILEIEGRDYSACGGTHVTNTAEIGLIKIIGTEKIRGHLRIQFIIGQKAYTYFSILHQGASALRKTLQTEPEHFAERAAALQEEIIRQKKQSAFYRTSFLSVRSKQLAESTNKTLVFTRLLEGFAEDASWLAKSIVNDFSKPAFILSGERFYFLTPKNSTRNAALFLKQFGADFLMRGCGAPDFVQGIIKSSDDIKLKQVLNDFIKEKT